jgi:hypothetical protein
VFDLTRHTCFSKNLSQEQILQDNIENAVESSEKSEDNIKGLECKKEDEDTKDCFETNTVEESSKTDPLPNDVQRSSSPESSIAEKESAGAKDFRVEGISYDKDSIDATCLAEMNGFAGAEQDQDTSEPKIALAPEHPGKSLDVDAPPDFFDSLDPDDIPNAGDTLYPNLIPEAGCNANPNAGDAVPKADICLGTLTEMKNALLEIMHLLQEEHYEKAAHVAKVEELTQLLGELKKKFGIYGDPGLTADSRSYIHPDSPEFQTLFNLTKIYRVMRGELDDSGQPHQLPETEMPAEESEEKLSDALAPDRHREEDCPHQSTVLKTKLRSGTGKVWPKLARLSKIYKNVTVTKRSSLDRGRVQE